MGYDRALAFVLAREGGRVDDKHDRGGRTNQGVTQRVYDAYREKRGLVPADVWEIGEGEVKDIYRTLYWDAVHGDTVCAASPEVALCTFDYAVNSGPGRAVRKLQKALGVAEDGAFGPASEAALLMAAARGYPRLVRVMLAERELFFRGLVARDASQERFLKGWLARVNHLRVACGIPEEEI